MVTYSDLSFEGKVPTGAFWALSGAILYAVYLVALRRRVDHEDKLDIPLFFGKYAEGLFQLFINFPWKAVFHLNQTFRYARGSGSVGKALDWGLKGF